MSNNKQSSVEWLFQNMFEISQTLVTGGETQYELMKKTLEQAKAMHKEEIMDAHGEEQSKLQNDGSWKRQTAKQYYNETFNSNEQHI